MLASRWKTCLVDVNRALEFSGDDVDKFSMLIDLEDNFEFITVIMPTLESTTIVTPYIQMDAAIDSVPVAVYFFHNIDLDTDVIQSSVAATGGYALTFRVGGVQHLRIHCGTAQGDDRTFYVRGFNRG